jgi:hypothetical protein
VSAMRLIRGVDTHTVVADGYQLFLRDDALGAVVADAAGHAWSRLSLLGSLDRVDVADESYDLSAVRITEHDGVIDLELTASSPAWTSKTVRLRCCADRLEYSVRVTGRGTLADALLLGGRAMLPNGACGLFGSSVEFASVFDPTPTEPIQAVRSAATAATLGVVGDANPGRLHGIFAPPPLCLAFGRAAVAEAEPTGVPDGDWLAVSVVAPIEELRFTELRYAAEDGGFRLELDYDGHTEVDGEFVTPTVVIRPAADPWAALSAYRDDLVARGFAPAGPLTPAADWWSEPIFCGWGAQCARAAARQVDFGDVAHRAADLARQDTYDGWLARLADHDVVPGTIVLDDQWETVYGAGEPHPDRWPDLRSWIAERHAAGQRVLLWWKAWDPAALTPEQSVVTPSGTPLAADPGSPAYVAYLEQVVARLLGPDGLDADGFKVDFLQRAPAGRSLRRPGAPADAPWGIAALHALLGTIHRAAKAAKPDALVITHSPHPSFGDVTDMLRLNDILVHSLAGDPVTPARQLAFRHAVVAATMPEHLIDTDQWPIATRDEWRDYVSDQVVLGVPSLYYAEHLHFTEYLHFAERIDHVGDDLTAEDLALVAESWRKYRAGRA